MRLADVWELGKGEHFSSVSWCALSVTNKGDVFILASKPGLVVHLDHVGKVLNETGGYGFGPGEFDSPADIHAKDGLNVYVADTRNNRIQRLASKLEFVSAVGENRGLTGNDDRIDIRQPGSVSVSAQGDLFYVDGEKLEVVKVNRFRKITTAFGGLSLGAYALRNPGKLWTDQRNVFVTDGRRIVQFDYFGNFVRVIESPAVGLLSDVAVLSNGEIITSDSKNKCIHRFSPDGKLLESFLSYDFIEPVSIDVRQDVIYVLDAGTGRVIMLRTDLK